MKRQTSHPVIELLDSLPEDSALPLDSRRIINRPIYAASAISNSEIYGSYENCVICLNPMVRHGKPVIKFCNKGHTYHKECIKKRIVEKKSGRCPVCRLFGDVAAAGLTGSAAAGIGNQEEAESGEWIFSSYNN